MLRASCAAILTCVETELDRELENAQAALLARFAPDARVRRIPLVAGRDPALRARQRAAASVRPRWVGRRIRGGADPRGARGDPPRARSRPTGSRAGRSVRLSRRRPARPRSDVPAATSWMRSSSRPSMWSPTRWARSCPSPSRSTLPSRVSRLALVGAPFGITRRPPLLMLPLGLPLIGHRLGRYLFSNATRNGSRKFFGQLMVEHPERVDDRLLDVDVAHTRRNVESMLSLIACVADWRRLGYRRELILGERWRALTTPTLLLWPEHDAFGSPEEGEALVAMNPNLRLVRLPGQATFRGSTTQTPSSPRSSASSRLSDEAAWKPSLSRHGDPNCSKTTRREARPTGPRARRCERQALAGSAVSAGAPTWRVAQSSA